MDKRSVILPFAKVGDPALLPPLTLAYIGDAVYEIWVRSILLDHGTRKAGELHKEAIAFVCASRQAALMEELLPLLTEAEESIFRRGRNAKSGHQPPNMSLADYHKATGLEALVGYWYLCGENERLEMIFDRLFAE